LASTSSKNTFGTTFHISFLYSRIVSFNLSYNSINLHNYIISSRKKQSRKLTGSYTDKAKRKVCIHVWVYRTLARPHPKYSVFSFKVCLILNLSQLFLYPRYELPPDRYFETFPIYTKKWAIENIENKAREKHNSMTEMTCLSLKIWLTLLSKFVFLLFYPTNLNFSSFFVTSKSNHFSGLLRIKNRWTEGYNLDEKQNRQVHLFTKFTLPIQLKIS